MVKAPAPASFWKRVTGRCEARSAATTLTRSNIYILPTGQGIQFAVLLLVMLLGSLNYNNSLGLMLTFLLVALSLVSILHTYRNMVQLTLRSGKTVPAFATEEAGFELFVDNPHATARQSIVLQLLPIPKQPSKHTKQTETAVHIAARASTAVTLNQSADARGLLPIARIKVSSCYPLGLFRAWSYAMLDSRCLIYPKAAATSETQTRDSDAGTQQNQHYAPGHDDFHGLRSYTPGDSLRHLHWKALAREQGLLTKQFAQQQSPHLWLNWDHYPQLHTEARLSQLCRGVLDAHDQHSHYGLRLPGCEITP
ncbi:MAG: DUF58 domain-containing protein, partial [Gammaproteobacteria bacterium]|nr:DUF58 domain-containing protein [Gammaproteobacteria bacterium]